MALSVLVAAWRRRVSLWGNAANRGRPGPGYKASAWKGEVVRLISSSSASLKGAVFQGLNFLLEEFVIHGDFSQLLL